jgi:hypothetical protein
VVTHTYWPFSIYEHTVSGPALGTGENPIVSYFAERTGLSLQVVADGLAGRCCYAQNRTG